MRNGLRPQPARLVRGSSRRIMTMRFRPANIRVINRRACSCAAIGPAVQRQRSKPTSGNVFPLRRPSQDWWMPERCSPSRVRFAAPKSGAPLTAARRSGRTEIATGGSGGNTSRLAAPKQKAGFPPAEASRPETKPSNHVGLDRSLHIRTEVKVGELVAIDGHGKESRPR